MMPYHAAIIGASTKLDKDDEENETVRREIIICKRELSKYDSNDYAAIPHLSDEHKNLVIESWDFVSDFVSEVGVKRPIFLFITDYNKIVNDLNDLNITN